MNKKKILPIFISIFFFANQSHAFTYVIKKGDNLSTIAYRFLGKKVYGSSGSLEKLLSLNPQITNPDFILPNQVIELGNNPENTLTIPQKKLASEVEPVNLQPDSIKNSLDSTQANENSNEDAESFFSDEFYSSIGLAPSFGINRLDTSLSGNDAGVLTDVGSGLDFDWTLHWSKNFSSYLSYSSQTRKYKDAPNRTVNEPNKTDTEISLGADYKFNSFLKIGLGVGYGTTPVLTTDSPTTLKVISVPSTLISLDTELTVFSNDSFSSSLAFPYKTISGSEVENIKTEGGSEYGAGLILQHHRPWGDIIGKAFYKQNNSSFGSSKTSNKGLNSLIGFRYYIGRKK